MGLRLTSRRGIAAKIVRVECFMIRLFIENLDIGITAFSEMHRCTQAENTCPYNDYWGGLGDF